MTTRYVEILANQSDPEPIGTDENNRHMFSCNYRAMSAGVASTFEQDIASRIGGVLAVDTFIGPNAVVPVGDGPYTELINTGGVSPLETHNGSKYPRLSIQVVVRARTYVAAQTRARAIPRSPRRGAQPHYLGGQQ